jgi:hypothetical protein
VTEGLIMCCQDKSITQLQMGMEQWWNGNQLGVESRNLQINPNVTLYTINLTWSHLALNPRLPRQKPARKCLIYNTALQCIATGAITTAKLTVKLNSFTPSATTCHTICTGQNATVAGFSPSISVFPCQYHFTNAPYSFICHQCYIMLGTQNIPNNTLQGKPSAKSWV